MTIQPDVPTIAKRCELVRKVIESYGEDDPSGNIIDLLADLQHYCKIAHGYYIGLRTFDELLALATRHFDAEVGGEAYP